MQRGRAGKPQPQPPPQRLPKLCRRLGAELPSRGTSSCPGKAFPSLAQLPRPPRARPVAPCIPAPRREPGRFTWHLIHPTPALPRGYLQGMVYGSSVGDQLIKRGRIEMLPEGHQSHQLVCRNLGESDRSSVAGRGTPRLGHVPHGTVLPAPQTWPCGTEVPSAAVPSAAVPSGAQSSSRAAAEGAGPRPCRAAGALSGLRSSRARKPSVSFAEGDERRREEGRGGGIAAAARASVLHPLLAPHLCRRGTGTRHCASLPPACSPGEARDGRGVLGLREGRERRGQPSRPGLGQNPAKGPCGCPRCWLLSPAYGGQSLVTATRASQSPTGLKAGGVPAQGGAAGRTRTPAAAPGTGRTAETCRGGDLRLGEAGRSRGRQQPYLRELPVSEPLHPPHARDGLALGRGSVGDDDRRPPGETLDLSPDELPNSKFLPILKAEQDSADQPKAQTPRFTQAAARASPGAWGERPRSALQSCSATRVTRWGAVTRVGLCTVTDKSCTPLPQKSGQAHAQQRWLPALRHAAARRDGPHVASPTPSPAPGTHSAARAPSCTALPAPAPVHARSCLPSRGLCKHQEAFSCPRTNQELGSSGCHGGACSSPGDGNGQGRRAAAPGEGRRTLLIPSPTAVWENLAHTARCRRAPRHSPGRGTRDAGQGMLRVPPAAGRPCAEDAPRAEELLLGTGEPPSRGSRLSWCGSSPGRGQPPSSSSPRGGQETGQSKTERRKRRAGNFGTTVPRASQEAA